MAFLPPRCGAGCHSEDREVVEGKVAQVVVQRTVSVHGFVAWKTSVPLGQSDRSWGRAVVLQCFIQRCASEAVTPLVYQNLLMDVDGLIHQGLSKVYPIHGFIGLMVDFNGWCESWWYYFVRVFFPLGVRHGMTIGGMATDTQASTTTVINHISQCNKLSKMIGVNPDYVH